MCNWCVQMGLDCVRNGQSASRFEIVQAHHAGCCMGCEYHYCSSPNGELICKSGIFLWWCVTYFSVIWGFFCPLIDHHAPVCSPENRKYCGCFLSWNLLHDWRWVSSNNFPPKYMPILCSRGAKACHVGYFLFVLQERSIRWMWSLAVLAREVPFSSR